jgi:hypothetical protein
MMREQAKAKDEENLKRQKEYDENINNFKNWHQTEMDRLADEHKKALNELR